MFSFEVNVLLITITTCFLTVVICNRNPLCVLKNSFTYMLKDKQSLMLLFALLSILLVNKLQLKFEGLLYIKNYATYFYRVEGEFLYALQSYFYNPSLTLILTYFYIVVFTSMLIVSFFVYSYYGNGAALKVFSLAILLNYLIAIPFFMFFGVTEVWFVHPKVKFLIPQFYPNFELEYRKMSGLDNSFPSLHTSISITMAYVAYHFNYRKFAQVLFSSAIIILFSIIYLGIHWFSDMFAGFLLAFLSVKMAITIVSGEWKRRLLGKTKYFKGTNFTEEGR